MEEKTGIAIAGSHGKTSTTALLSHILIHSKQNPSLVVGGHINSLNSNAQYGEGSYFIAEADESDRSLLILPKKFSIITNVDLEHLETYKNFDDIKNTFINFINSTPTEGKAIICYDDPGIQSILPKINSSYRTYGTSSQADIQIQNIKLKKNSSSFSIYEKNSQKNLGYIDLQELGFHYILNATSAITLALELGIPFPKIQKALSSFAGVDRRFTFKGKSKQHQCYIFDDYGHHPKEIECSLKTARNQTNNKLVVVFQPHRYTRTKHLWDEFVSTFTGNNIDTLIINDIYPASEKPIEHISSKNLVKAIKEKSPQLNVLYCPVDENFTSLLKLLNQTLCKDDLLLLLGAGKVNKIATELL